MLRTVLNLTWKELLQLFRDRLLLAFLIAAPMLQLALIAQSTGAGLRNEKFAVWDQDRSTLSQQLITALDNTAEFELAQRASSYQELKSYIDRGQVVAAVIIPPNFARDAARPGVGATIPVLLDGTNVLVANNILTSLQGAINQLSFQFLTSGSSAAAAGGINYTLDIAYNPTLNTRWSTLPATLAFITYQVVLVVAAVSFVRERELGTMEQLVVTPLTRLELILGKSLMAALIGLINFLLLILLLQFGFQVPLRGSLLLLIGLGLLFVLAEIGVGMLISLGSTSQQQAILIVFMLAIIEITFSGLLVPTENMPAVMRALAMVSPLQHFTAITRAVFIKAAEFTMLLNHVVPLALLAAASMGTAWTLFNRIEW